MRHHVTEGRRLVQTFEPQRTSRGMHFQALEVQRCVAEGRTESARHPLDDSVAVLTVLDELRRQLGAVLPQDG